MELTVLDRLKVFSRVREATTNVRAQTRHSIKGKAFSVKQHQREIDAKTVFHGTKQSVLDRILAQGIVVQNYRNWDYLPSGENEKEVFVTTSLKEAWDFGLAAWRARRPIVGPPHKLGAEFAVVEAVVPAIGLTKDGRVESGSAFTLKEVKPQWIKKVHFYKMVEGTKGWDEPKLERTVVVREAASYKKVFIPLPIDHPLVIKGKVTEAEIRVRAQVRARKKSGKVYAVKSHTRTITRDPKQWVKNLSKEQISALIAHTSDPEMNLYLRRQVGLRDLDYVMDDLTSPASRLKERVGEFVDRVDSAIDAFELPKDTVVYRGMSFEERKPSWLKVGAVMSDKAWVSTSKKPSVAKEMIEEYGGAVSVLLTAKIPKGTKAAPVFALKDNEFQWQDELLLKRGSRFKIKKIQEKVYKEAGEVIGKKYVVEATYVKP